MGDNSKVYRIKGSHGNDVLFYKRGKTLYAKFAYSMLMYVLASSFKLDLKIVSSPGTDLVQIPIE